MENGMRSMDSMQAECAQVEKEDFDNAVGDVRELSLSELTRISGGTASVSFL